MGLPRRPGPIKPSVLRQRRRVASAALAACLGLVAFVGLASTARHISASHASASASASASAGGSTPAALVGRIGTGVGTVSLDGVGAGRGRAGGDPASAAAADGSGAEAGARDPAFSGRYRPSTYTYERLEGDSPPSNLTRASLTLRRTLMSSWPEGKPRGCFFALVRSSDAEALASTMLELDRKFNDRDEARYPYVFVNDVEFDDAFVQRVRGATRAPVLFGRVPESQWRAPDWIDMRRVNESMRAIAHLPHGGELSYRSMCRYYARFFQHHELLDGFEYAWRIEPGVRYRCEMPDDAFRVMSDNGYAYGWNIIAHEIMETVAGLWATASQHWTRHAADLAERNTLKPLFNAWPKGGARQAVAAAARWARGSSLGAERHEQVLDAIDESGRMPDQYEWPLLKDEKALEAHGPANDPACAALRELAEAGRAEAAQIARDAVEASRVAKRKAKEAGGGAEAGAAARWAGGAAADEDGHAVRGGALGVAKATAGGGAGGGGRGSGAVRAAQRAAENARSRGHKRSWAERHEAREDGDDREDVARAALRDGGERSFLERLARRQESENGTTVDQALAQLSAALESRDEAGDAVGRSLLDRDGARLAEPARARAAAAVGGARARADAGARRHRQAHRFSSLGSRAGAELHGDMPALPSFVLDDLDAPSSAAGARKRLLAASGGDGGDAALDVRASLDLLPLEGGDGGDAALDARASLDLLPLEGGDGDELPPGASSDGSSARRRLARRLLGSLFGRKEADPYHLNCTTHPEWHLPVSPVHALPGPRRAALEAAAAWRSRRAVKAGLGGSVPQYVGYHFWSNFEIVELAWLRSEAYDSYVAALDDSGGFFYERWGDAPVRSLAVAALLDAERVRFFDEIGYTHAPWTHCPRVGAVRKRCDCAAAEDENVRRQSYPFSVWVAEHDRQAAKAPGGAAELAQPGGKKRDADDPWKKTGDDPFKGSMGDPETGV